MTSRATPPLVGVIDDDSFLELMRDLFTLEGYRIVTVTRPTAVFALLRETPPDLMILDLVFERTRIAGLALLRTLRADVQSLALPVIVASAATDLLITHEREFAALNAATLAKPFGVADLVHLAGTLIPGSARENAERKH